MKLERLKSKYYTLTDYEKAVLEYLDDFDKRLENLENMHNTNVKNELDDAYTKELLTVLKMMKENE